MAMENDVNLYIKRAILTPAVPVILAWAFAITLWRGIRMALHDACLEVRIEWHDVRRHWAEVEPE